jgi:O-antigen/teichoic acid export membrane protein
LSASDVLKRGLKFTAVGQFASYGIRFCSNLILTRLLAPDYFGVMAIAILFVYAATMLCDVGLRSAIIAEARADDRRYRDTVWSVMTLRVLALALIVGSFSFTLKILVSAGWISHDSTYADPRLDTALALLVIAAGIHYIESIEILYRERMLDFRTLFKIELIRQVISTAVTLTWALLEPSIFALVAGPIVANACISMGSYIWLAKRAPRFVWSPEDFKFLWSRGRWLWVSAVLTFSMNILDRLTLARYFDATQIGVHSIAVLYSTIVTDLVAKFVQSVVFPLVSRSFREGDTELWRTYYKSLSIVVKVALPSGFLFITFGDKLIELLYDARYHPAGPLLRAFGIVVFLSIYSAAGEIYVALGQAKIKSTVYFLRLFALLTGLIALVPAQGLMGGVWALVGSHVVGGTASLYFNRKLGMFKFRREAEFLGLIALLVAASSGLRAVLF